MNWCKFYVSEWIDRLEHLSEEQRGREVWDFAMAIMLRKRGRHPFADRAMAEQDEASRKAREKSGLRWGGGGDGNANRGPVRSIREGGRGDNRKASQTEANRSKRKQTEAKWRNAPAMPQECHSIAPALPQECPGNAPAMQIKIKTETETETETENKIEIKTETGSQPPSFEEQLAVAPPPAPDKPPTCERQVSESGKMGGNDLSGALKYPRDGVKALNSEVLPIFAVKWCGDVDEKNALAGYKAQWLRLWGEGFRQVLAHLIEDVETGRIKARKRGAVLMARLKKAKRA